MAAAREQVRLYTRAQEVAQSTRWFGSVQVGVSGAHDPEGPQVLGPVVNLELPIFDQRQALIEKLQAQLRQSQRRCEQLEIDVRSDVRMAHAQLLAQRAVVQQFEHRLLPLRQQVVR